MHHYSNAVQREQHRHCALLVYDELLRARYNNVSCELPYRDIMRGSRRFKGESEIRTAMKVIYMKEYYRNDKRVCSVDHIK